MKIYFGLGNDFILAILEDSYAKAETNKHDAVYYFYDYIRNEQPYFVS